MTQEPTVVHVEPETDSGRHVVHMLMQFAMAVRYRKNVVIISVVVSFLLFGLYYATATRRYIAKAGLVLQINADSWSPGMAMQENWEQNMLPTYEGLISRSEVIKGAIERIPREHRVDFGHAPPDEWVKIIQDNLSVSDIRRTNIVEVGFRSKDPNAAVTVVNAVVDSYQDFMDKTYRGEAGEYLTALNKKKESVEEELAEKEKSLWQSREQTRDLGIDADSKVLHPAIQQVVTLEGQLSSRRLDRQELEAQLKAIQTAIGQGEDLGRYVFALAGAVDPEVLRQRLGMGARQMDYRDKLMASRLEDMAKLEELRKCFGPRNPEVVNLEARIRQTTATLLGRDDQIQAEVERLQDGQLGPMLIEIAQQKLKAAAELEARLSREYEEANQRAVDITTQLAWLKKLERECERLEEDRALLNDQIKDVKLQSEGQEVTPHIVDWPKVNFDPVSPRLARTVLLAMLSGVAIGLMLVYVMDILDDRFRSMEEMQALLGVSVLAMVRELESSDEIGLGALQAYVAPNATESEAFRTLRTTLSLAEDDTHQIVVSSPEPGDGKTTVLANLAVAIAQSGKRTLLIDADLRRPGLTALLGMRGIDGLSTVIRGEDDIVRAAEANVRPSGLEGLDVLPSGPRPTNPAELLGSRRFSELLAWAESVYDQILIDSPPTLATSDTAVIGRLTNAVMLVVQPAKNRRRLVMRCVESLAVLRIPLLGIVVNRIGSSKDGGYYGYGYGGYYGYDYAYRYGGDSDGEDEAQLDLTAAAGRSDPADRAVAQRYDDEALPPGGIVPRRVA
jgi:succinoglycan biosynthesis transport protein ExoP